MDLKILEYTRDMILQQIKFIEENEEKDAGMIAMGLTKNQDFLNVVHDLMSDVFLQQFKIETPADPKEFIIDQLNMIEQRIQEEIEKYNQG